MIESDNIILGGKFYQEFFGIFQNGYQDTSSVDQTAIFYVGQNSIYPSYIGAEELPQGVNPFIPTPPAPAPAGSSGLGTAWIVVIALIGALLIAFLAFLLYRYKVATAQKNVRGSNVVYGTDGQVNASAQD
jgi:hypothetical protein